MRTSPAMMRRSTRSTSNVEAMPNRTGSASLRRSLRSTNIEEFYEIPTNFRTRSPRPAGSLEKTVEKSPSTRRSSRLNAGSDGDEFETKFVEYAAPCQTRKRRFTSCPTELSPAFGGRKGRSARHECMAKDINGLEIGPKPSKLMYIDETSKHSSDNGGSSSSILSNGICNRTRLKREYLKENGISDVSDDDSSESSTGAKKAVKEMKTDVDDNTHSQSENGCKDDADSKTTPRKTRSQKTCSTPRGRGSNCPMDSTSGPSTPDTKEVGEISATAVKVDSDEEHDPHKCVCKTVQKSPGGTVCGYCGKPCLPSRRRNGSIKICASKKPPDITDGGSIVHSLRSNSRTTMSPFSSPECAGSPIAAEEAGVKTSTKVNGDDSYLQHQRRRSRRLSEKGDPFSTGSSDPEEATSDIGGLAAPSRNSTTSPTGDSNENGPKISEKSPLTTKMDENKESRPVENGARGAGSPRKDTDHVPDDEAVIPTREKPGIKLCDSSVFEEFSCGNLDLSGLSDVESGNMVSNRRRRMNLRSSGVRCDPDFYTLSLDLMIKRPMLRRHLHCETETSMHVSESHTPTQNASEFSEKKDDVHTEAPPAVVNVVESDGLCNETDETPMEKDIKSLFTNICDAPESLDTTTNSTAASTDATTVPTAPPLSSTPSRPGTTPTMRKIIPPRGRGRGPKGLAIARLDRPSTVRMVVSDPSEPPPLYTEEPPSGPDVYFFESDHVALKHNKDYHDLLHIVSTLESQRRQSLKDIQTLENERDTAINAPIEFVEKLQKQVKLDLPTEQKVPSLPEIDWSRYSSVYGTFDHVFSQRFTLSPKKPVTRKVKINFETGVPLQPAKCSAGKQGKVKGEVSQCESSRSRTFNIPWTVEEQRRLEELLQTYPSEDIVFNRYRKIATALGNRTALQVQSRVQKYFLKLAKAGLPIPGHMPRMERYIGGSGKLKKARPHPHTHLTKMSTFFPKFHVPVRMQDDTQEGGSYANEDDDGGGWTIDQDQVSDEEDVSPEMRYSDEYLEILRLKRMRRERLKVVDQHGRQALAQHVGYECDMCNCDPIQGVRYHCIDCPTEDGVDLCQSCIRWQGQFETESHRTSHRMEPVYKADNFMDDDYIKFMSRSGEYNYLDPNFFPPNT